MSREGSARWPRAPRRIVGAGREASPSNVLARVTRIERPKLPTPQRLVRIVAVVVIALVAATAAVGVLESPMVGLTDASPVYFVAIALVGSLLGTWPAVASALAAFLAYDAL